AAASGFLIPAHVDKPVREWGCAGGASGPDRGRCDGLRPDGPDSVVRRDSGRGAEHPGRRGGAAWWGREVGGRRAGGGDAGCREGEPPRHPAYRTQPAWVMLSRSSFWSSTSSVISPRST